MPTIKDENAIGALNDEKYINKLYDTMGDRQKDVLETQYNQNQSQLNAGQEATGRMTGAYLDRTRAESPDVKNGVYTPMMGTGGPAGRGTQAALSFGNQRQKNISALTGQQAQADAEYERRRKDLADQYSAAIKQAQAENDMARARQLYDAAKAEEEQLRKLRQQGADLMAGVGDMSVWDAIAAGTPGTGAPPGESWEGVTQNEEALNKIYDAMLEGQKAEYGAQRDQALSDLAARQRMQQEATDQKLNELYVQAQRGRKNAMEAGIARGQNAGTTVQDQIARANALTEGLTELRRLQGQTDSDAELDRLGILQKYGNDMAKGTAEVEGKRLSALYEGAKAEEQALADEQKGLADAMAARGDYSLLGKLYGLTPEQIAKLQQPAGGGGSDYRRRYSVGTSASSYIDELLGQNGEDVSAILKSAILGGGNGPSESAILKSAMAGGRNGPQKSTATIGDQLDNLMRKSWQNPAGATVRAAQSGSAYTANPKAVSKKKTGTK